METMTLARRFVALFAMTLLPLALSSCGGEGGDSGPSQSDETGAQPLSAEAQALVAQGNEAQRSGRYEAALEHFSAAMEIHPDHAVPQFGALMAAMAVGDSVLAQSLREKLAVTGPELLEMLGPGGAMGSGGMGGVHTPPGEMPPGHPAVEPGPGDTVSTPTRAG